METGQFKLTYSTMFNPPEELHTRFEQGLAKIQKDLGKEYPMLIAGKPVFAAEKFQKISPANTQSLLGVFQKGSQADADMAIQAAKKAFPIWSHYSWQKRVEILRKASDLIESRIYEIGAAMALEVGKNRMEALGDVAESIELIRYACLQMENNAGFVNPLGFDPLDDFLSINTSILRPYGVWLVISPFNFPAALSFGPTGAALVAGNTVVLKPATDTPWSPWLISDCFLQAGLPEGVLNFVTGPGSTLGQALIDHSDVAGITFTGSFDVGMGINRSFGSGRWVRPAILELGGKNPVIVSRQANLEDAADGIIRSAFGLQGQKCSAASRIFIEEPVYAELVNKLVEKTGNLKIGNPTDRQVYLGPVINKNAMRDYQSFCEDLRKHGNILTGAEVLTEGSQVNGYFCAPTLVNQLPLTHRLWKEEMFLPIATLAPVNNLSQAMEIANDVAYGLTAGFYGAEDEINWFYDHIEAGVVYANRPQGATTGAWPGYQPFGGWKGSGSSGKNAGGLYYVQLYCHEQIRNRVKRI